MNILTGREYHINLKFQGDDGVDGKRLTSKPLNGGLWCAMQTFYRMSQDPDNYLKDSYIKLVTFTPEGREVLCACIVLEEFDRKRTYFLQYTNGVSKKTHDVCSFDSGLWCAITSMCRYHEDRQMVQRSKGGYFTLCFYQGKDKKSVRKVLLQMGA